VAASQQPAAGDADEDDDDDTTADPGIGPSRLPHTRRNESKAQAAKRKKEEEVILHALIPVLT
jgi:hypothetical protein